MATMRENASIIIAASRQMRAIIELAEQIADIETLELQVTEKVNELNGMLGKVMDAKKALADAEKDTAAAKEEAAKLRKDASAYAKLQKEKAEIAATARTKAVEEEASKLLSDAKAEASSWDQRVVAAQKEFDALKAEISSAEKQLASTKASIEKLVKGLQNGNV